MPVNYLTVHLMGGLGNQLFQIFTTISNALKYKVPFKFAYSDMLTTGMNRPTYWNNFLKSLKIFTDPSFNSNGFDILRETHFHYNHIQINHINRGLKLYGYFQSYKYFKENYSSIIKLIKLKETQDFIKNKYNHYFSETNISIHFRLGDYKNLQDYHPIMKPEYYQNSLNIVLENIYDEKQNNNCKNIQSINLLYFCEKEDNQYVVDNYISKLNKEHVNIIKIDDTIEDWEQLIIMSCCSHNIIANSSFSWWGAYFNQNQNKIVCYPQIWFGDKMNDKNTKDLCPNEWIKVHSLSNDSLLH